MGDENLQRIIIIDLLLPELVTTPINSYLWPEEAFEHKGYSTRLISALEYVASWSCSRDQKNKPSSFAF